MSASPFQLGKYAVRARAVHPPGAATWPANRLRQPGRRQRRTRSSTAASCVVDAAGEVIAQAPSFQEDLLLVDLDAPPSAPPAQVRGGMASLKARWNWACATTCASAASPRWCWACPAGSTRPWWPRWPPTRWAPTTSPASGHAQPLSAAATASPTPRPWPTTWASITSPCPSSRCTRPSRRGWPTCSPACRVGWRRRTSRPESAGPC